MRRERTSLLDCPSWSRAMQLDGMQTFVGRPCFCLFPSLVLKARCGQQAFNATSDTRTELGQGVIISPFYTWGPLCFKTLRQSKLSCTVSQSHHLKSDIETLLLHHDQHENVLAACSPLWPFKHQKQNGGRKQRCTRIGRQPRGEECASRRRASPVSPQDAVHFLEGCRWKTQADGKEGPAPEKHTHTHTVTHFQSVYSATMDSSTVMSSGFPPARTRPKSVRN